MRRYLPGSKAAAGGPAIQRESIMPFYSSEQLRNQLNAMHIDPAGTLLVHSSMKAVGQVEGGPETVLDVLCDYMKDGLLIFPTHTWRQMNENYNVFHVKTEPSCVGLLSNLFLRRENAVRSFHPTHSVAAIGRDAADYTAGEENARTPCPRNGCWGKLCDRDASILFIGCSLKSNTYLHGVEEWENTPNRLADTPQLFTVVSPDGQRYTVPQYKHHTSDPVTEPSEHYDKMEPVFLREGALRWGSFGDARCMLCSAVKMAHITASFLRRNPHLFDNDEPVAI